MERTSTTNQPPKAAVLLLQTATDLETVACLNARDKIESSSSEQASAA